MRKGLSVPNFVFRLLGHLRGLCSYPTCKWNFSSDFHCVYVNLRLQTLTLHSPSDSSTDLTSVKSIPCSLISAGGTDGEYMHNVTLKEGISLLCVDWFIAWKQRSHWPAVYLQYTCWQETGYFMVYCHNLISNVFMCPIHVCCQPENNCNVKQCPLYHFFSYFLLFLLSYVEV